MGPPRSAAGGIDSRMSTIQPFASIRYASSAGTDLSTRLAPPYDVLDQRDKDALLARDPRNFVLIDLPHMPPKSAGPESVYQQARRTLDAWLADGTLVRERMPALYVYYQEYEHAGRSYLRKKFFARLRLEAFGAGSVFPHEQTFGGPKEDRLSLTRATQCNLSPIFGLYEDAANAVAQRLGVEIDATRPLAQGVLDGVTSKLWAVSDAGAITDVQRLMESKATYIADGHHRYGTALMYRDWLAAQRGPLPPSHPANFVLCAFCAMEDPGLLILPTHRVLPQVRVTREFLAQDPEIRLSDLPVAEARDVAGALAGLGQQAFAVYLGPENRFVAVGPKRPDVLAPLEPRHTPAWHQLALAFLHAYVIERAITPRLAGGKPPEIHYLKNADAAVAEARSAGGTAFLMQPNTMEELRAVCQAGDLMPQKSTFFFPKVASGLVINPLSE